MRKALVVAVTNLAIATLCTVANAQQLPKSGSFDTHTGWKDTGDAFEVAEKCMMGGGNVIGMIFNVKGSGPIHTGPATCFYTFFVVEGSAKNKGFCSFGDADGDRIFTDWHGEGTEGINMIVGGTGKYAGIQGSGPWKSKEVGPSGQLYTTQRFDYRLPL